MLDPNISPKANDGLGGSSKTADMLAESSGREVAKATRILPTKSLPSPVIDASMSPYFAKYEPNKTVATALNAKIIMLRVKISIIIYCDANAMVHNTGRKYNILTTYSGIVVKSDDIHYHINTI